MTHTQVPSEACSEAAAESATDQPSNDGIQPSAPFRAQEPPGAGAQIVSFLRQVEWSKISGKGWLAIAFVVLVPIGLVMKAFGYESTTGQPPQGTRGGIVDRRQLAGERFTATRHSQSVRLRRQPLWRQCGGGLSDAKCDLHEPARRGNEIQDHGVFFSGSVDATGKGRHQVIDSNWVVVGQSPAAGTAFGEGDAELSVVKYGETSQCG